MSILELPIELILQLASYLDWNREDLCPSKPDIVSLSATCSQMRGAVIPLVFKDVTLRLRWQNGALVEPCLYKLRMYCPILTEHIRSVCIRTNFEDNGRSPQRSQKLKAFVAPKERPDWLDLASEMFPGAGSARDEVRNRADRAAQKLILSKASVQQDPDMAAEKIIGLHAGVGSLADSIYKASELDALTIAMLCVPRKTNNIILVSLRQRDWSNARNKFAARVAAHAMALLQKNIEDLTIVSNISSRDQRAFSPGSPNASATENKIINPHLISQLAPRRLVLAMSDRGSSLIGLSMLSTLRLDVWHNVSHTVRILELRYIVADTLQLLQLVRGFVALERLSLRNIVLHFPRGNNRSNDGDSLIWLTFCLDLRSTMQHTTIELKALSGPALQGSKLPPGAAAWIRDMAIPAGTVIDFERQERLLEDFQSFLPLWNAEAEEHRGVMALKEWNSPLGRNLCDAAMSRRWG